MRHLLLAPMLAFVIAGCDSSAPQPIDEGPWPETYAMAITLMANTPSASSLVFSVPSLGADTTADYSRAVTLPDTATLFGVEGSGSAFATTAQTPDVRRYDFDDRGTVTPGPSLNFARFGLGATYSTRSIVFVSPSKAYLLDDTTLQAITFDPTAMETGTAIDLSELGRAGYRTNFSYNIPVRGDQLVIAAFYYDATYSRTIGETAVALLDTRSDTVRVIRDTRCGAFSTAMTAPNGDVYFGTDTYASAIHRIGGDAAAPDGCLLRMRAGEDEFDPDFFVRVSDLTGGQLGGAVVPADDNALWVRAFDESLFAVSETTSALRILAAPAWRWWRVDLGAPTATAVVSPFPPGAGQVKYFGVGGRAFAGNASNDYSTSDVLDMTSSGAPRDGVRVMGYPSGVVRVR